MALIQLLAAATATAAGKVAAAATVVAVAGGGVAVAATVTEGGTGEEDTVEQSDLSDEETEITSQETETEGEEAKEETEVSDEDDPDAEDDRRRSSAVHEALAGDSEARPGDGSDFGQAVSENARENPGAFGPSVAASARGDDDGVGTSDTEDDDEGDDEGDEEDEIDDLEPASVDGGARGNSANAPGRQARD